MIDTDKYEGHTEGEWMFDHRDWQWAINIFGNDGKTIEANAILIQDAPIILAEVKRLREVIDKEHPTFDWASRQTIANLEAEVKRLRKNNYKLKRFVENIEWGLKEVKE